MWELNGPPAELYASQAYSHAKGDRRVIDKHIGITVCQMVATQILSHITIYIIPELTHLGLKINKGGALYFKQFYFSLNKTV